MGRGITRHPSIYQDQEGTKPRLWHTWLTVGHRPDGRPKRRHIKGATRERVEDLLDEALAQLDRGGGSAAKVDTVATWLRHWLEHVVKPRRAYNTHVGYRTIVELHVIPHIGDRRLAGTRGRLEPEHLDRMYTELAKKGLAESYVLQIHRVLNVAMKAAVRRHRATRNVCELVDAPTARRVRVRAHSLEVAQKIIRAALDDELAPRWLIAMVYGARQGEALGIHWRGDDEISHLDLDADPPMLHLATQVQRRTWEHGCKNPAKCVRELERDPCRRRPCPPRYAHGCPDPGACRKLAHFCPLRQVMAGCNRHRGRRGCPPLCEQPCVGHARLCPDRTGGGLVEVRLKTARSVRSAPLLPAIADLLIAHRERQQRACEMLGRDWDPTGLVFATAQGAAPDPRRDHERWEQLLAAAGVPDSALHAARHDAATFMVATGADISVVREVLGHTDIRTTGGYVDVATDIKRQAVEKVAAALLDGALGALLQPSDATLPGRS